MGICGDMWVAYFHGGTLFRTQSKIIASFEVCAFTRRTYTRFCYNHRKDTNYVWILQESYKGSFGGTVLTRIVIVVGKVL